MLVCAVAAVLATSPASAGATPARDQIAALNAQRAASGIPAGIVEVPGWSEGCRKHMAYIAANGGILTHAEEPGNPGYSAVGAEVGRGAVITPLGDAFSKRRNAFERGPLHLMQTLAPALSRMGVWGGCATTNLGFDRTFTAPSLYTYPGNGLAGFYVSERADDLPNVPGDFVGLPQGTTTGPHILVMTLGTGPGRITRATLASRAGPVEIRTVDNFTDGLQGWMPPGGIIIPVRPLARGVTYTASATFAPSGGGALSRTWSFTTARGRRPTAAPQAARADADLATTLQLTNPRPSGRSIRFTLRADPRLVGRRAFVTTYRVVRSCSGGSCRERRQGRRLRSSIESLAATQPIYAPRPVHGRTIVVLVQTRAFTRAGVAYAASRAVGRWAAP